MPKFSRKTIVLAGGLICVAFAVDLLMPLGVAVGTLYVAVPLMYSFVGTRDSIAIVCVLCTGFIVAGAWLSPHHADLWIVVTNRALAVGALCLAGALGLALKKFHIERDRARAQIEHIRTLIPMCASCRRVRRDAEEPWSALESFVQDHLEADFSHGLCQACAHTLYPDLVS